MSQNTHAVSRRTWTAPAATPAARKPAPVEPKAADRRKAAKLAATIDAALAAQAAARAK
jgi:hypothetical protein